MCTVEQTWINVGTGSDPHAVTPGIKDLVFCGKDECPVTQAAVKLDAETREKTWSTPLFVGFDRLRPGHQQMLHAGRWRYLIAVWQIDTTIHLVMRHNDRECTISVSSDAVFPIREQIIDRSHGPVCERCGPDAGVQLHPRRVGTYRCTNCAEPLGTVSQWGARAARGPGKFN